MRSRNLSCRLVVSVVGAVLGAAAGVASVTLASAAPQQGATALPAVFDVTHLPPLLTMAGEQIELAYDVHCATGDTEADVENCDVRGAIFVRAVGGGAYERIALTARSTEGQKQLVARVPDSLSARHHGFEYYAVLEASGLGERVVVPAGGAEAPHISRLLENRVDVALGRHAFGRGRRAGARLVFAAWGDGSAQLGLESGRNLGPIGASAFDVDAAGTVVVLDQAHRRLLRWSKGARLPVRVPISVRGTLADLAVGNDGSTFVLESTAEPGRHPLVRRFDDAGRELEAIETAERTSSQIRMAPSGPFVLEHPSHHWMPVTVDGVPGSQAAQLRHGRSGRELPGGREIVVYRHANELRIAVLSGPSTTMSWRITSDTPLAEVQLAEPLGQRLVAVVRLYDDRVDEFVVLTIDRTGLVDRFTLDPADWAETAPLGRFRLVGRSLYRLGSTPAGAFVDRFDLEVR
jgi:hypothetical protein